MKKKNSPVSPVDGNKKANAPRTNKDIDDLVHSAEGEISREAGGMDPDDLVHQPVKKKVDRIDAGLADPDDLAHDATTDDTDVDDRR